jgi:hypothetical protein
MGYTVRRHKSAVHNVGGNMRFITLSLILGVTCSLSSSFGYAAECGNEVLAEGVSRICLRRGSSISIAEEGKVTTYSCADSSSESNFGKIGEVRKIEMGSGVLVLRAAGDFGIICEAK